MSKTHPDQSTATAAEAVNRTVAKGHTAWRAELTPEQHLVLPRHDTQRPSTWPRNRQKRRGMVLCAGCGAELFGFDADFDSRRRRPSFDRAAVGRAVSEHDDPSYSMHRTEVRRARCDGHLGHRLSDSPDETPGLRSCITGAARKFKPDDG